MSKKIEPQGKMIIVLPSPKKNHVTEGNIEIIQMELEEGTITEFSKEFEGIYEKGQTVVFPAKRGISVFYKGKNQFYINGEGYPTGDVISIVSDENSDEK